jgi:hypothetical protein
MAIMSNRSALLASTSCIAVVAALAIGACGGADANSDTTPGKGGANASGTGGQATGGGAGAQSASGSGSGGGPGSGGSVAGAGGAAGATACTGPLCSACPSTAPANGSACTLPAGTDSWACTWGSNPALKCRTSSACDSTGKWTIGAPPPECATLPTGCPVAKTGVCTGTASCLYPDGAECACQPGQVGICTEAPALPAPCPRVVPNQGSPCSFPTGTTCTVNSCTNASQPDVFSGVSCIDGAWIWQRCLVHVCASPDTRIATPAGERRIAEIEVGDLVYSVDRSAVRAVPVVRVRRQRAHDHRVVRVTAQDGSVLEISAPHPTADGRSFGDLRPGESLDGHVLETVEVIPYAHEYTYDILPASDTGFYFAAGMLIGSTLASVGPWALKPDSLACETAASNVSPELGD